MRSLVTAAVLVAAAAGAGYAQSAVGVSAVILESIDVTPVEVQVRAVGRALEVVDRAPPSQGTKVLERTFVKPVPAAGAAPRVEDVTGGRELRPGAVLRVDRTEEVRLTRVVAANS